MISKLNCFEKMTMSILGLAGSSFNIQGITPVRDKNEFVLGDHLLVRTLFH